MVDRAMDGANPRGPLEEVIARLNGTSRDTVELKQGYVAVTNRDTRMKPVHILEEFKAREAEWLTTNLPGYIGQNKATSQARADAGRARASLLGTADAQASDGRER